MPDVVKVSTIETRRNLLSAIERYFESGQYAEITQAIGMHSLLIESEHTLGDQQEFYRFVLGLIKNRAAGTLGKTYAAWYADFPGLLDELVTKKRVVVDQSSVDVLSSRRAAFGAFKSLEDFFFWCLDDRRLSLAQIVKYIEATVEHGTR